MNICYTCITGAYDKLLPVLKKTKGWRYIAFVTGDVDTSDAEGWDMYIIGLKPWEQGLSSVKLARAYKLLPFGCFASFRIPLPEVSIWIDGRMQVQCDLNQYSDMMTDDCNFVTLDHPDRICIYEEIEACRKYNCEDHLLLDMVKNHLEEVHYPVNQGMIQSGVMIRKKCEGVFSFCSMWWDEVLKFSKRDQLSFNYVLLNNPELIKHKTIPSSVHLAEGYFCMRGHL